MMKDIQSYVDERKRELPLALRRGEVVSELSRCGLGGEDYLRRLLKAGTLTSLSMKAATQARYRTSDVMTLIYDALTSPAET